MKLEFTTAAFLRSHGTAPRGHGRWGFQQTTRATAFSAKLVGEIVWVPAPTLSKAKQLLTQQGRTGIWAVLP